MSVPDRLKEALVGGIAGLAVVTFYIIIRAKLTGATDGEWLSFAGAVTGTGLAVAGAAWIEHQKRRQQCRAEVRAVLATVVRLRSLADLMLTERPDDIPELEWQDTINQMPEYLASYADRLDQALNRLTAGATDSDVLEAGDGVLRIARRAVRRFASGDTAQVKQTVATVDLLRNGCDVAIHMLTSRLGPGQDATFEEAIEGRGRRIH